jgi:hypothetical protein
MTRIACHNCHAEADARDAILYCHGCYSRIHARIERIRDILEALDRDVYLYHNMRLPDPAIDTAAALANSRTLDELRNLLNPRRICVACGHGYTHGAVCPACGGKNE